MCFQNFFPCRENLSLAFSNFGFFLNYLKTALIGENLCLQKYVMNSNLLKIWLFIAKILTTSWLVDQKNFISFYTF